DRVQALFRKAELDYTDAAERHERLQYRENLQTWEQQLQATNEIPPNLDPGLMAQDASQVIANLQTRQKALMENQVLTELHLAFFPDMTDSRSIQNQITAITSQQ